MFKTVTIQLVQTNLANKTASKMLLRHTNNKLELESTAKILLEKILYQNKIRRVGVCISELSCNINQSNINSFFLSLFSCCFDSLYSIIVTVVKKIINHGTNIISPATE